MKDRLLNGIVLLCLILWFVVLLVSSLAEAARLKDIANIGACAPTSSSATGS
jgi:hypothetical protein